MKTPPTTATVGQPYSYTFLADGVPTSTYSLTGAPSWLTINPTTGLVSGIPRSKTTTFSYTVIAANGVAPNATAGPFTVSVSRGRCGRDRSDAPGSTGAAHDEECDRRASINIHEG